MKIITDIIIAVIIVFAINIFAPQIAKADGEDKSTTVDGTTITAKPFDPAKE